MSPNKNTITIYDSKLQNLFEDWIIESGLKIKFNVVTYLIETQRDPPSFLQKIGLTPHRERKVFRVLTNQVDILKGESGSLLTKYSQLFCEQFPLLDDVIISEVKDQDRILKGVKRKLKVKG